MRLAALYSGGKDSTYAMYLMEQQGHVVDDLVCVMPSDPNSWIFHTPNLHLMPLMAEALGKRLVTRTSSGEEKDDLAALRDALTGLEVDGVVTGAIASDYQWDRINEVCADIGLRTLSPLWRKDQYLLLDSILEAQVRAIFVNVSAEGMGPEWLGRELDRSSLEELKKLARKHGMNVAGEGGEYETMVIDSPMHRKAIRIEESELELTRDGGRLKVKRASLEDKG